MAHKKILNYLIFLIILLASCGEDKKSNNSYKKQTDIPATGQSIIKKNSPTNKVGDYY